MLDEEGTAVFRPRRAAVGVGEHLREPLGPPIGRVAAHGQSERPQLRRARKTWLKKAARFLQRKQDSGHILAAMRSLVSQGTLTLLGLRQRTEVMANVSLRTPAANAFFEKHAFRLLKGVSGTGRKRRSRRKWRFAPSAQVLLAGNPLQEFLETKNMHIEDNLSYALR